MTDHVMTVTGAGAPQDLGFTLTHEHVLVDFAGADSTRPDTYDLEEAFDVIAPHIEMAKALGCRTLVECTPAYIGRSPGLLKRLAIETGMQILTNTGYYGAADDKYLPPHAFRESASMLADRWTAEWEHGIEETGVRPGFIKIGVDPGPLSDVDRKLVQAAARTHLRTGLLILSHTGPHIPAFEQLEVLEDEGVDAGAWVWTHAQNEPDDARVVRAAQAGAWVALDGVDDNNVETYASRLSTLKEHGLLNRVLLSHDAGWYSPGEPRGGSFRSYEALSTALLPALREQGFTEADVHQVTEDNPTRAFAVQRRPRV